MVLNFKPLMTAGLRFLCFYCFEFIAKFLPTEKEERIAFLSNILYLRKIFSSYFLFLFFYLFIHLSFSMSVLFIIHMKAQYNLKRAKEENS